MKEWFQQLNHREQSYVFGGAIFLLLYLLFVAVWRPLDEARDDMAETNNRTRASLERVQFMATELQQLQSSGGVQSRRNLSQLINVSTSAQGINPSRIQASSSGSTQIRFEEVNLVSLLRWLHQVENQDHLIVRDASISQGDRGGVVDASIRISLGG